MHEACQKYLKLNSYIVLDFSKLNNVQRAGFQRATLGFEKNVAVF